MPSGWATAVKAAVQIPEVIPVLKCNRWLYCYVWIGFWNCLALACTDIGTERINKRINREENNICVVLLAT